MHEAIVGRRFRAERAKKAKVTCTQMWLSEHEGRYWKRQLSKARRRAWKQDGIEGKPINIYESTCNWKGW